MFMYGYWFGWLGQQVLIEHEYAGQSKAARGLVRRYIEKMTGLSRAQTTRLIRRYTASGRVRPTVYRRRSFPQRYTRADIELLASVDEAHETLSGPATRRILEREVQLYGKQEYARLAAISVAHLYNLRNSQRYRPMFYVRFGDQSLLKRAIRKLDALESPFVTADRGGDTGSLLWLVHWIFFPYCYQFLMLVFVIILFNLTLLYKHH